MGSKEIIAANSVMITKEQVMSLLAGACPSYHPASPNEDLLYVALGDFAIHLLQLQRQNRIEEFVAVAQVIERLHIEGNPYVREAATIGLLEGIQNTWSGSGTDPELFARHLLPVSAKWWRSLNDFWAGKNKHVGENL